jgi:CHASE2 domain-containing sensor protein
MNRLHLLRRLKHWITAWPAILIVSSMAVIDHYGVFEVADGWILDSQFSLLRAARPEVADSRVAVIAVDEATLKASKTPMALWHQQYGQLFEWLATVRPQAIGFDIVLPERGYEQRFPGTDQSLMRGLQALRSAGIPVIVAHSIDEHRKPRPIYAPFLSFVDPQYGIGSDVLIPDADHVVRRHTEALGLEGGPVPTFAGQVVRAVRGRYTQGLLNYRIIQDIPIISAQILFKDSPERQKLQETLKDKVVIIGSMLSDTDRLVLPLPLLQTDPPSRQPGVIVQANIVSALLNQSLVRESTGWPAILLLATTILLWPVGTTALRASVGLALFAMGI